MVYSLLELMYVCTKLTLLQRSEKVKSNKTLNKTKGKTKRKTKGKTTNGEAFASL